MDELRVQEAFGRIVRKHRQSTGQSQEEFALGAGLDRTYISAIELGRRNVSLRMVAKIAAALSLTLAELFTEVEALA